MKMYKVIYMVAILLNAMSSQKAHAQNKWEPGVDTFKINEGEIIDSTIIDMLDSAFTFLRLPAIEMGLPYYYRLYITKDEDTLFKKTSAVSLSVKNYLIFSREDLDWFNEESKLLLHYKDVPILVYYDSVKNDTVAFRYIKPTSKKGNFYFCYKKDKYRTEILYRPDKWYEQTVKFFVKKKYMVFMGYTLHIDNAESFEIH